MFVPYVVALCTCAISSLLFVQGVRVFVKCVQLYYNERQESVVVSVCTNLQAVQYSCVCLCVFCVHYNLRHYCTIA